VNKEEMGNGPPVTHWAIALDWFQQNNRSIAVLIRKYLCPSCAGRLSAEGKENSTDALMSAIKDCCSHNPDFITDRQAIAESIFRLFLANGNQPLALEELGSQLSALRGGDPYRTSPETLGRILRSDCYYGLHEFPN
jgi:hypothetical protein